MANEIGLFEGAANVPAHLQGGELSDTAKALGAGGGGLKWISIKGGVFRMMVGNQEVATNEDRSMKMVVVASAPGYARTYYADSYKEGVKALPACWSDDGNAPSPNVPEPQSNLCASCPQNVKGSGASGGRACRYSARLAVVLEGDMSGDVYGLNIPATSIFGDADSEHYLSLQEYVKKLAGFGYDVVKVVTEMKFDTKSPVPKLMFRAVRPLDENEWEKVKKQSDSQEAKTHTGERKFERNDEEDQAQPVAPPKPKTAKKAPAKQEADDEAEEVEEPKKVSKKKEPEPETDDISDILDEWGDEED
jgi:hypothetical protein